MRIHGQVYFVIASSCGRFPPMARPRGGGLAGIGHQPLKARFIHQHFKQLLPYSFVTPAGKTLMHRPPFPIFRRQVAPRRPGAQYPEYGIDKQTVVLGDSPPIARFDPASEVSAAPKLHQKRCTHVGESCGASFKEIDMSCYREARLVPARPQGLFRKYALRG